MNKRGAIAISQIFILVIGIIAIGYAIGSELRVINGLPPTTPLPGNFPIGTRIGGSLRISGDPVVGHLFQATPANPATLASGKIAHEGLFIQTDAGKFFSIGPGSESVTAEGIWSGMGVGVMGNIAEGFLWAGLVYGMITMFGPMLGLEATEVKAASLAAFGGIMAGKIVYGGIQQWIGGDLLLPAKGWSGISWAGWIGIGAGVTIGLLIFYSQYKKESQETISFTCEPWEAPVGGSYCEKCNTQKGGLPCSEYQCRSLGQACQLLNPGTDEERCEWVNKNDVTFPIIEPWKDALLDDYEYKPDKAISPPDRGVIVFNEKSTTGCAKAFTPLTFGIILNEPGKCKLDYLRKQSFDEMEYSFGGSSLFKYNHTQVMSLPGKENLEAENMTLQNNGNYEIYARCQDANGNTNTANFVFKFCVEQGPDTTPPLIVATNLINNMPIAYNQSSVDLEAYINEPANCKWSYKDQSYNDMEEQMSCLSSIMEMNAQMLYKCSTTLTGLKNREDNKFYFRCQDKPLTSEDKNTNAESYEFVLKGTQPLVIDSIEPNGTIKDSTDVVKVSLEIETSAGYNEGEAICYYSDTENEDDYIMFFETNSYKHFQDLHLLSGDYEYFIKCLDLGGNRDNELIKFTVESDSTSPIVVRAFHEETYLKLITNEPAECVYDTIDCSYLFDDGTSITALDDTDHYTDWKTDTNFYVKCQDEYGNQPLPNECSIIVKPFEVYGGKE